MVDFPSSYTLQAAWRLYFDWSISSFQGQMPVCVRVRVENREREDTDIVCLSIVKPQQTPRIKPDAIEILTMQGLLKINRLLVGLLSWSI